MTASLPKLRRLKRQLCGLLTGAEALYVRLPLSELLLQKIKRLVIVDLLYFFILARALLSDIPVKSLEKTQMLGSTSVQNMEPFLFYIPEN